MKRVLFGVGAIAATVYAAKKMIDMEMEKEYLENLEKQWEEEANFEVAGNEESTFQDSEDEVEQIFAESNNPDMSFNLWDKAKEVFNNVKEALPRVTITINVEDRNKDKGE